MRDCRNLENFRKTTIVLKHFEAAQSAQMVRPLLIALLRVENET